MDWFLYDRDFRHKRVNTVCTLVVILIWRNEKFQALFLPVSLKNVAAKQFLFIDESTE